MAKRSALYALTFNLAFCAMILLVPSVFGHTYGDLHQTCPFQQRISLNYYDWRPYDGGNGDFIEILGSYDGESHVLHLHKDPQGSYGFGWSRVYAGRIDLYAQSAQIEFFSNLEIQISSEGYGTQKKIRFSDNGHFQVYNVDSWYNLDVDTTYSANTWYEIGLEFNLSSSTFKTYINGALKSTDPLNDSISNPMFEITFTAKGDADDDFYISWMDWSWDPGFAGCPPIPGFEMVYIIFGLVASLGIIMLVRKRHHVISP